eukprot:gb/GECH01006433.1/.p1 GENE.gb/GECH01006433.1/~~gb/GECH01006433.1/.p1  ORF type:complete len:182 (+),score=25.59 gb/GECH01006433.1/:1-546(+)
MFLRYLLDMVGYQHMPSKMKRRNFPEREPKSYRSHRRNLQEKYSKWFSKMKKGNLSSQFTYVVKTTPVAQVKIEREEEEEHSTITIHGITYPSVSVVCVSIQRILYDAGDIEIKHPPVANQTKLSDIGEGGMFAADVSSLYGSSEKNKYPLRDYNFFGEKRKSNSCFIQHSAKPYSCPVFY